MIDLLARAVEQTGDLVAGVSAEQMDLPTPCASWNLRALINHVIRDLDQFTVVPQGGSPDWTALSGEIAGDDWAGAFRSRAATLVSTWRSADLDMRVASFGGDTPLSHLLLQQVAEFSVHSWDIAVATHQPRRLDDAAAQAGLDWAREALKPMFRGEESEGKAFGPEVPVPGDAPAADRLAGFFGRSLPVS